MAMMEVLLTNHSRLRLVRLETEQLLAAQALKKLEEEINVLAERIAATERASVTSALERRIEKLEMG